jgi:hypothetical protein
MMTCNRQRALVRCLGEQSEARFRVYRENIDNALVSTYVYADDLLSSRRPELAFGLSCVHQLQEFSGRIKLGDEGEAATEEDVKATETKKPPPIKPPEPLNL